MKEKKRTTKASLGVGFGPKVNSTPKTDPVEPPRYPMPTPATEWPDAAMDMWRHRSAGMRCKTCMYYVPKVGVRLIGRCRRHAPTTNGWPALFPSDWCGDHKLDENKTE